MFCIRLARGQRASVALAIFEARHGLTGESTLADVRRAMAAERSGRWS